jgi:hypothetical protein
MRACCLHAAQFVSPIVTWPKTVNLSQTNNLPKRCLNVSCSMALFHVLQQTSMIGCSPILISSCYIACPNNGVDCTKMTATHCMPTRHKTVLMCQHMNAEALHHSALPTGKKHCILGLCRKKQCIHGLCESSKKKIDFFCFLFVFNSSSLLDLRCRRLPGEGRCCRSA